MKLKKQNFLKIILSLVILSSMMFGESRPTGETFLKFGNQGLIVKSVYASDPEVDIKDTKNTIFGRCKPKKNWICARCDCNQE